MPKSQFSIFFRYPKNWKLNWKLPKQQFSIFFRYPKNWKLNWKLPKQQCSISFVIRKIENWIENCPKSIFLFLKLLKIEQKWKGRFRTRMLLLFKLKLNFNFLELFYKSSKFSLDKIPKYLFDKLLFFIL